jgi:hypothetical protein
MRMRPALLYTAGLIKLERGGDEEDGPVTTKKTIADENK